GHSGCHHSSKTSPR
ncbi:fructose-1,6-bisphosphatase, class II, partial [Vibrio parahaemolyticus V-223/04]